MRYILWISLGLLCGGCATFEYDIVRPPELAQHIGSDKDLVINFEPARYYLRSYENHLVIQIYNPGSSPIQVHGRESSVVDPDGISHPLRWAAEHTGPNPNIAPGSNLKLILPPLQPPPPSNDSISAQPIGNPNDQPGQLRPPGLGGAGSFYSPKVGADDQTNSMLDDVYYWQWDDESNVRLNLVLEQDGHTFKQEILFHRKKM